MYILHAFDKNQIKILLKNYMHSFILKGSLDQEKCMTCLFFQFIHLDILIQYGSIWSTDATRVDVICLALLIVLSVKF